MLLTAGTPAAAVAAALPIAAATVVIVVSTQYVVFVEDTTAKDLVYIPDIQHIGPVLRVTAHEPLAPVNNTTTTSACRRDSQRSHTQSTLTQRTPLQGPRRGQPRMWLDTAK